MSIFAPRYKHYAAWPIVIWCRLRGHIGTGRFWSGTLSRCVECGDAIYPPGAIASMQRNIDYWGDRCCKVEAENAKLRATLKTVVDQIEDYERINNLAPNPGRKHCWDSVAQAHAILAEEGTK